MQFTKKVFSDLADGFNIALVDCSTDFSLLSTFIVYTFELQQSPNQTIFLLFLVFFSSRKIVDPYGENTFSVRPPVCVLRIIVWMGYNGIKCDLWTTQLSGRDLCQDTTQHDYPVREDVQNNIYTSMYAPTHQSQNTNIRIEISKLTLLIFLHIFRYSYISVRIHIHTLFFTIFHFCTSIFQHGNIWVNYAF